MWLNCRSWSVGSMMMMKLRSYVPEHHHRLQPSSSSAVRRYYCGGEVSSAASSSSSSSPSSRALKNLVLDKIRVSGPITVAEYMKLASAAYYSLPPSSTSNSSEDSAAAAADAGIGRDFITSPEISQMFGELVGVWCAYETWKIGHRGPWQLVELGPGNGSLVSDCLKTMKQLRLIRDVGDDDHPLSVHLVELSDQLAAKQERLLCDGRSKRRDNDQNSNSGGDDDNSFYKSNISNFGPPVFWYKDLADVPRQFSVFLLHEFFDALPVHKFGRSANGKWREIYIDADFDERGSGAGGRLKFALAPCESFAQRTYLTKDVLERLPPDADHVEISAQSLYVLQQMIDRITEEGGFVLIVDYGYNTEGGGGDTLRGFRKHQLITNFLDEEPGSFDITADVNFRYLRRWAEDKACCFGPMPQGTFLKNLGIEVRLNRLLESAKTEERSYLRSSYEMLVNEDKMGSRFKVMALFPKVLQPYLSLRPPAGFAALG